MLTIALGVVLGLLMLPVVVIFVIETLARIAEALDYLWLLLWAVVGIYAVCWTFLLLQTGWEFLSRRPHSSWIVVISLPALIAFVLWFIRKMFGWSQSK